MDQNSGACAVRQDDTFTRRVINRCIEIIQTLDAAQDELRELSDRNHGPGPEAANGADAKYVTTCGRHQEVEQLLGLLAERADLVRAAAHNANASH